MNAAPICITQSQKLLMSDQQTSQNILRSGRTNHNSHWHLPPLPPAPYLLTACFLLNDLTPKIVLRSLSGFSPFFRTLVKDSASASMFLEWSSWNERYRVCLGNYAAPNDNEDACVVDLPDGGVHFFATVEHTESCAHLNEEQPACRSYRIVQVRCLPSPISSNQLNVEPACSHNLDVAASLVPHPSLPLLFAFTPTNIVCLLSPVDVDPASPCAVRLIDVNLSAAPPPSSGGIWGLAVSVKALVGFSGNRSSRHNSLTPPTIAQHNCNDFTSSALKCFQRKFAAALTMLFRTAPPKPSQVYDDNLESASCIQQVAL
jgi:hypothetical protein